LHAEGDAENLIVFTSTLADPVKGSWYGILFTDFSTDNSCIVTHAVIEYADIAVDVVNASPRIEQVTIRDANTAGVQVSPGAPQILNCFIRDSSKGIYLWFGSTPTISGNFIYDNDNGIYTYGSATDYPDLTMSGNAISGNLTNFSAIGFGSPPVTVTAENNFWEATTAPEIAATIFDRLDESTYPATVDFDPWLSTMPVLVVYNVEVSRLFISPNGDGDKDDTTVTATLTKSADWAIHIRNSSNTVVRTLTGSGASVSKLWDGRDNANAVVPDGVYTVEIFADDGSSAEYLTDRFPLTVDNTVPTVVIATPGNGSTVSGINTISGTADDPNFYTYAVEYGVGASPSAWVLIFASEQGVTSGHLASWDARLLANGTYTLRVSATDNAGNDASTQVQVTLDNIQITGVSASPQFFTPGNATTTISYTLDRAANVTIKIYELNLTAPPDLFGTGWIVNSALVATPVNNAAMSAGLKTSTWNGRDDSAVLLPFKAYSYSIEAATTSPNRQGYYNPPYAAGRAEFANPTATSSFDPYKSESVTIHYELIAPAWVNVKIMDPNLTVVQRDFVTWAPADTGAHDLLWDGRANNGSIVTAVTRVRGEAQLLPDNSVVTLPRSSALTSVACKPYLFRPVYREITNIQYTIASSAKVAIKVYDPEGVHFVTLQDDSTPRAAGSYSLEWSGTNLAGVRAYKNGNYRVEVASTGIDNDTVTRSGAVTIYR
jgi:parallel beta-helix repeat protein